MAKLKHSALVDDESIEAVCRKIVEDFHPDKIILFGSHASGEPGPDSDVDLLVIMAHEGRPADTAVEIRLRFRTPFPMDILVRSPEKIKQRLEMKDPFFVEIMTRGKVLYEADY